MREGLHGLIGRLRLPGTALIVEDVCVPPERIAEGARDLQALLGEHGFLPGVAGHASAGNLHFMLTPDFAKQEDLERYEAFMGKLVELIVGKYDGSLKAEHGTGINMAPYVEREWGEKATELMWRVKQLADPDGVLNPGVVLNRDPGVHLRNLKTTPAIEESATTCVECGFCEPVCPSRNLTTTPRQRIVLRREMARQPAGSPVQRALLEEFAYEALDTCAADGSCQLACPVGIDTGKLVKELRAERHTPRAERAALAAAKRWHAVERASRAGLKLGGPLARRTKRGKGLPGPASAALPATERQGASAVYVPSCTNRIFGPTTAADGPKSSAYARNSSRRPLMSVVEALVEVSRRAGLPVWIPADVAGSCCGLPFGSKGFGEAHAYKANALVESLWRWSGEGALPVVIDAASCTQSVAEPGDGILYEENVERLAELEILDSVAWAHDRLLPKLEIGDQGRLRHRPPDLRHPPHGPGAAPALPRRRPRRGRLRRPLGDLLRLRRRPRHHPPRADRGRHKRPGRRALRSRLRRPPLQQPHLRDRPQPCHRRALRVGRDPARAANAKRLRRRRRPCSPRKAPRRRGSPRGRAGRCRPACRTAG